MTQINWDLLRLFSAVIKTGSVNRAAQEIGMSQPTVSRRLQELERYVGAPLFFRVPSGVRPTPEGENLYQSTKDIATSFESLHKSTRLRATERSAILRISSTEGLTKHWLLPRVPKLHAINPDIQIEIDSTNVQQNLAFSDLDFVIRMGNPFDNELIGKRVATAAFGIFASKDYLARNPAPQSLADLEGHDIIGNSTEFSGLQRDGRMQLLTSFLAVSNRRSKLRLMPIGNHSAAAAQGLGLAFLPVPFALAEGLVRVVPRESSYLDVWLLRRRESDLRKLTRQARRLLESELANSRDWFVGQSGPKRILRQKR
jgi:DNA-binding transcriptional LysR family regulator